MSRSIRPFRKIRKIRKIRKMWGLALVVTVLGFAGAPQGFGASTRPVTLQPNHATPGATLSLSGKGFGNFTSVQTNNVTVNGVSPLVQRWEADLIEVKVPFKATSGQGCWPCRPLAM